ncbi:MAG: DUF542 domain-containing protein [bacterium]
MTTHDIDPSLSVNDILRRYPSALALLTARGVDTCCDGGLTLSTAATDVGLDVRLLVRELAVAVAIGKETSR